MELSTKESLFKKIKESFTMTHTASERTHMLINLGYHARLLELLSRYVYQPDDRDEAEEEFRHHVSFIGF